MKIFKKIPLSKVYMDSEIIENVQRVLKSGQYILGKECAAFEEEFADFVGTKYAAAVSSGTAAIWLSLLSLKVKPGDEIIVPSHTAFPTIEPILLLGAKPVFVDIDDTYTLDPLKIEGRLTKKTVGIIPVHLYGHPANMGTILNLAHKYKLFILEDCCQAHGAKFRDKLVGSIGNIGCFSFYPSKNLTVCGDGGMVVTNNATINKMIRALRDHGRTTKYRHSFLGFNERFNEIQAAIGRIQLKNLNRFNSRRREIANSYCNLLQNLPIVLPQEKNWAYHAYHMFVVRTVSREKVRKLLSEYGIGTGIHYPIPSHLQPPITKNYSLARLPLTEKYCSQIISLPVYPSMNDEEVQYICRSFKKVLNDVFRTDTFYREI